MDNLINSCIATCIAEFVTSPICLIKSHVINSPKDTLTITKELYNTQGIVGFFKASPLSVFSQVLSTSSKYVFYRHFLSSNPFYLSSQSDFSYKVIYGVTSGACSSLITHPFDFIRVHIQMGNNNFKLKHIYRGYTKTLSKVFVGSCCFFPIYDHLNSKFNNVWISSLSTAIISTCIYHPLDYMKTRQIYGLRFFINKSMYRGLGLNLCRVCPHFCITMGIIDYLEKRH
jgi:hypothetical protein